MKTSEKSLGAGLAAVGNDTTVASESRQAAQDRRECEAPIRGSSPWSRNPYACGKTAKVEREGKWYCGTHDPVRVAEKQAARNAVADRQWAERTAQRRLENAAPDLLAALRAMVASYDGLRDILTSGVVKEKLAAADAAIAKAENALQPLSEASGGIPSAAQK